MRVRDALTVGLSLSMIVCSQTNNTPLISAAVQGHADCIIALVEAKAHVDAKNYVRVRRGIPADLDFVSLSSCLRSATTSRW